MLWVRLSIIVLALLCGGQAALCAQAPQVEIEKSFQEAKGDYSGLKNVRDPLKWQALAQRFMVLYNSQPGGEVAPKCLFWAGRVSGEAYVKFKRQEDMDRAIAAYDQFITKFPSSGLADDAQYNKAELYKAKGDLDQAYLEYLKVTVDFPKGDMRPKAAAQLDVLEPRVTRRNNTQPAINTPVTSASPPDSSALRQVKEIRQWSVPGYARVVLNLEEPTPYSSRLLRDSLTGGGEKSVQLDLRRAQLAPGLKAISPTAEGLLKTVQYSSPNAGEVRVVVTVKDLTSYKVFTLDNPFRLVVDCFAPEQNTTIAAAPAAPAPRAAAAAGGGKPATSRAGKPPSATTYRVPRGAATAGPNQIGLAAQLGLQIRTVVVDPGHGGKDPGAISGNLQEKDITLDISRRLATKLRNYLKCTVLLTRAKDVFLPLEERTAFANTKGADLFVSIHVNSAANSGLNGIETYFLNLATDEAAMRVAARENATTQRSLSDLQVILNDLMLNSKVNESNRLARTIHQQVLGSLRAKYTVADLKVKQAPFYVLIGARMPAVLCEVGFISNATERTRLTNTIYLDLLAEGIARGIMRYNKELQQGAGN